MIITSLNLFLHVLTLLVGMLPPTWCHGVTYSFAFPVNTHLFLIVRIALRLEWHVTLSPSVAAYYIHVGRVH